MKCAELRELFITDYLDGELEKDVQGEVARHLETCAGCRRFEEIVRHAAVEPFRGAPRETAPASLWPRVRQAIEDRQERGARAVLACTWRSLRVPALATASAVAVALVALVLVRAPATTPVATVAPGVDAEELHAYIQEQFSALAYNGTNGSEDAANGEEVEGSSPARFGTLVEEYLM